MTSGATATGNGAAASAIVDVQNSSGGWTIAGASGERASAWGAIQGGSGDVIATRFKVGSREVAIAVTIGNDPRTKPGNESTTLIGRAAYRGR